MKVIECNMLRAARAGVAFKGSNTEVRPSLSGREWRGCSVYLFGKHIADCSYYETGTWVVTPNICTLKAWPTVTTCSRLRALGVTVNVKAGLPYINGELV